MTEAKNALNLLFSKVEDNLSYTLPNGDPRYITIVEKKKETPNKYPRKAGMPNKRPLLSIFKKIPKKSASRLYFLALEKNDLQNHASLFCFLAREKFVYKTNFFCYTILSKGF